MLDATLVTSNSSQPAHFEKDELLDGVGQALGAVYLASGRVNLEHYRVHVGVLAQGLHVAGQHAHAQRATLLVVLEQRAADTNHAEIERVTVHFGRGLAADDGATVLALAPNCTI